MKLQYTCLNSALDLWPLGRFELGVFASRIERSKNGVCSLGLFLCFLMNVENLEMGNSLKWVLFNIVSGQITSDALWKEGEVFLLRI